MKLRIPVRGLRKKLRGLFAFKPVVKSTDSKPSGIVRTVFEDATINYFNPVNPSDVCNTQQCVKKFGRKQPVRFNQLTLANQLKN